MDPEGPSPNAGSGFAGGAAALGGAPPPPPGAPPPPPAMLLKDDPMYAKYFKMLKLGLPKDACKQKMATEGVDPNVMDLDPEGPSPNAATAPAGDHLGNSFAMPVLKRSTPGGGGGRSGGGGGGGAPSLMDQLKSGGGMSLKKVGHIERPKPPADPRSNLLDAIKGGSTNLKKTVVEAREEKPADNTGGFGTEVLNKLNAIRNATAADSSDSDSDWDEDDE